APAWAAQKAISAAPHAVFIFFIKEHSPATRDHVDRARGLARRRGNAQAKSGPRGQHAARNFAQ
ncbi:MAG TPA: hypothetical protein VFJ13_08250, partial [Paracoccaceae bacterium]|nr:hypothetical protein [Paracoccaceae bacterium]